MVDEFVHWSKPYLLLSSTYDEVLQWMINILDEKTLHE